MSKFETKDMEIEYTFRKCKNTDAYGSESWYEINIEKLKVFDSDVNDWIDKTDNPYWIEKAENMLIDAHIEGAE